MIDGMDWIEAYLRDLRLRPTSQFIISATGHEARTPRSVEAHGEEERDEDGHPVGTRVTLRTVLSSASPSGALLNGTSSSDLIRTITVHMPVTEVGPYVSNQIVDDVKFTAQLEQTWVPPTVHRRPVLRARTGHRKEQFT